MYKIHYYGQLTLSFCVQEAGISGNVFQHPHWNVISDLLFLYACITYLSNELICILIWIVSSNQCPELQSARFFLA